MANEMKDKESRKGVIKVSVFTAVVNCPWNFLRSSISKCLFNIYGHVNKISVCEAFAAVLSLSVVSE